MSNLRKVNLIVFVLFLITNVQAQISVGGKLGVNFADTNVDGFAGGILPEQTNYAGFNAGIIAEIPMLNGFSFRPELNYIQKGFITGKSFDVNVIGINMSLGARAKTRVNYIEMPLLIKYSYGNDLAKVYAIAGPTLSYATSAKTNPVVDLLLTFNLPAVNIDLSSDIYNRTEISGTVGLGGELKAGSGKLFTDVRYNIGFTNMLNNPIVDLQIKNQGFNISAGYAYVF